MQRSSALVGILVAGAVSVTAAQAEKKMDHAMNDTMQMTYTGCVESINHGAAFVLTHISDDHMMDGHGSMAMKNDAVMPMNDESVKMNDNAMKDSAPAAKGEGGMQAMTPPALLLTGALNMRKHAGQQVRITGLRSNASESTMPRDLDTLKVSSLKTVAGSCREEAHKP